MEGLVKIKIALERDAPFFWKDDAVSEIKASCGSHVSVSGDVITIDDDFYESNVIDILKRKGVKYSRSTSY
jgi:hypothetical protein